jgi:hypothetical protein
MDMHPRTVKKILEDEEDLDIGQMAGAILEEKKREPKKKHIASSTNQIHAYRNIQAMEQEKIAWRNRLAKVWPKQKLS